MKKTSIRAIMMLLITLILLSSCQIKNSKLEDEFPPKIESIESNFPESSLYSEESVLPESSISEESSLEESLVESESNFPESSLPQSNKEGVLTTPRKKCNLKEEGFYSISKNNYTSGNIIINYPQIENMKDKEKERLVNDLIWDNFYDAKLEKKLEEVRWVIEEHGEDEDYFLDMDYEVTIQTDEIISILYTGRGAFLSSMHDSASIYTLTIDLETLEVLSLIDFIDIDEKLIEEMYKSKELTNQINGGQGGFTLDELIKISHRRLHDGNKQNVIDSLLDYSNKSFYGFVVTPNSFKISIFTGTSDGDFIIIEIPYDS